MNTPHTDTANRHVTALSDTRSSIRLRAAMAIGIEPADELVPALIERCALEPDFYVRDMLTWALTRQPRSLTVPRLVGELDRDLPQARSQALHTLSKIGEGAAWPAITAELLRDRDEEVARSAWRAAVVLVPAGQRADLARVLATELGRGGREVQLSLSRALLALDGDADEALTQAASSDTEQVREHALATLRLRADPEQGFEQAVAEARRTIALDAAPEVPDAHR